MKLSDAKAAKPALRTMLQKDTEPAVRKAALEALGKIDPETYGTLLTDTFEKDKDQLVRLAVVAEISRAEPRREGSLAGAVRRDQVAA